MVIKLIREGERFEHSAAVRRIKKEFEVHSRLENESVVRMINHSHRGRLFEEDGTECEED